MIRAQGARGRGSRPGRGLSLDRIVTATLELVDEQGIGAATMRAVSARLGVRSMSLYRYVQDRDELFDAVVERIVNELADDPQVQLRPVDGWRPYLTGMAHGVRRYARAHPHAFPLVATRPPTAPWVNPPLRSLRWVEAMLTGLAGEGFSDEQVLFTYRTFNGFLLGYLLLETSAMALRDPKPGDGSFTGTDTADLVIKEWSVILIIIGALVLAVELKPRRVARLKLHSDDTATDAAMTRSGLAGALRAAALDIDGISSAAVTVRRRRARVVATSAARGRAAAEALKEPVAESARRRLDDLQMRHPPRLKVRVFPRSR